jgi:hypothetical protein
LYLNYPNFTFNKFFLYFPSVLSLFSVALCDLARAFI